VNIVKDFRNMSKNCMHALPDEFASPLRCAAFLAAYTSPCFFMSQTPSPSGDGLRHVPILQHTVVSLLAPQPGDVVIDATAGLGGHAAALLDCALPGGHLYALDADPRHAEICRERLAGYGDACTVLHANFRDLASLGLPAANVLLADIGLCSAHVDDPDRGFSFRTDAPLDLRFDPTRGESAAEVLARSDATAIRILLRTYGELREANVLALRIADATIRTTGDLVAAVESAVSWRAKQVLPQVFQALRIAVNDELGALEDLLRDGPRHLAPGGRMGVIAFHSLEDRLVKHAFRALTTPERDPVKGSIATPAPFTLLTPKAIQPSDDEITRNPRARSARLRIIRRNP
jgi:16S rRNA (cytosine1402-N4)-methyltransferase